MKKRNQCPSFGGPMCPDLPYKEAAPPVKTVAQAIELLGYWRTPTDDPRRIKAANILADAHLETVDRTSLRAALARKDAALGMAVEALVACEAGECTRNDAATALAACREAMGETL